MQVALVRPARGHPDAAEEGRASGAPSRRSPWPLDRRSIDDLLYSFSALIAERVDREHPSDLAQYGLAPPRAVATGTWETARSHTLLLGDKAPTRASFYLQVKGDPRVYSVDRTTASISTGPLKDLRSRTLAPAIN